jgi:hypothetical protein
MPTQCVADCGRQRQVALTGSRLHRADVAFPADLL